MPRLRAFHSLMLSAALVAQPALAQVDEADRLARCQNNRDALARLEAGFGGMPSEEQIARARTALAAIQSLEAQINANFDGANSYLMQIQTLNNITPSAERNQAIANANARVQEFSRSNAALGERIRLAAAPFDLLCFPGDYACTRQLYGALGRAIDASVAQRARYAAAQPEMQRYRTNLIALHCGEAAAPVTAGAVIGEAGILSGPWRDSFDNSIISISHNGREVSARRSDGFTYRSLFDGGDRIILTWTQNDSPGSQTGRISYDGNGRAVLIEFGGGISWVRQ